MTITLEGTRLELTDLYIRNTLEKLRRLTSIYPPPSNVSGDTGLGFIGEMCTLLESLWLHAGHMQARNKELLQQHPGFIDFQYEPSECPGHDGLTVGKRILCKYCGTLVGEWGPLKQAEHQSRPFRLVNNNPREEFKMTHTQLDVFAQVLAERKRQDEKHGATNATNTLPVWASILMEEVGEVAKECNEVYFCDKTIDDLRLELIQVMAVCLAMLELNATPNPEREPLIGLVVTPQGNSNWHVMAFVNGVKWNTFAVTAGSYHGAKALAINIIRAKYSKGVRS